MVRNPLLLPELFEVILDNLSEYDPPIPVGWIYDRYNPSLVDKEGRLALLALAQTCRDLSDLSLNRLWRKLGTLAPLIESYGGDSQREGSSTSKTLTRPTSGEFDIVRRYSTRISTLYLRDSASFLLVRFIGLHSPSFFPNLTSLVYDDTYPCCSGVPPVPIGTLACLLSSKVTSLEVVFTGKVRGIQTFLRGLHQICPDLRSFTYKHNKSRRYRDLQTIHHIPDLSGFTNLHSVTLKTPIDHIAFEKISISPILRELSAVIYRKQSTSLETPLGPADIPFRNAKRVVLEVWDLDFVTSLLRPMDQAFDYIEVSVKVDRPTADSVYEFFKSLASHQLANSLQTIRLARTRSCQTTVYPASSILRFLTSFRHLEVLVIDLGNFSIDDEQLVHLACFQNSLRVLELTCREASWSLAKHPTLRGVLSLAGSCQRLRTLTLSIDAQDVPQGTDPNVRNTTLQDVAFLYSPISDPRGVAKFISKHFPSVTHVASDWAVDASPWREYLHRWNGVNEKLRVKPIKSPRIMFTNLVNYLKKIRA